MNKFKLALPKWTVTALLLAASSGGCVKRTEVVAVLPDGRVEMVVMMRGDVEDIQGGEGQLANDPPPSKENGWQVIAKLDEEKQDKNGSSKREMTLVATQSFVPGQPLPTSFAKPNTPLEAAAKKFYTEVNIEKTNDGTLYHFKRTYPRRVWAPFEFHRQRFLETDEIKKLLEAKPDEVTEANRKTVAEALIAVEVEQQVELLQMAITRTKRAVPQMAQLEAIGCIRKIAQDEELKNQVVSLLINKQETDTTALEARLNNRVAGCIQEALVEGGLGAAEASLIVSHFKACQLEFEVSKDLGDESWDVELALPGKIVAHDFQDSPERLDPGDLDNSDPKDQESQIEQAMRKVSDSMKPFVTAPGFETYSWSFEAEALRDRDIVLMATSFVPNQ